MTGVLKQSFLSVLGGIVLILELHSPAQCKEVVLRGQNSCSYTAEPQPPTGYPTWDDGPLESNDASRSSIVREAAFRAYKKLAACGNSLHLVKAFNWQDDFALLNLVASHDPSTGRYVFRKHGSYIFANGRRTVVVEPKYVTYSREANLAARLQKWYVQRWCPFQWRLMHDPFTANVETCCGQRIASGSDLPYWDTRNCNLGYDADPVCYREELHAEIEILPEVFQRRRLWIPSEGRWARSLLEAVGYLILHELGHLESYVSSSSQYAQYATQTPGRTLAPVGDEEADAWEFASTVMRCKSPDLREHTVSGADASFHVINASSRLSEFQVANAKYGIRPGEKRSIPLTGTGEVVVRIQCEDCCFRYAMRVSVGQTYTVSDKYSTLRQVCQDVSVTR